MLSLWRWYCDRGRMDRLRDRAELAVVLGTGLSSLEDRYEIELRAALVIALAAYPDGITLTALLKLGWQPTSDSPEP